MKKIMLKRLLPLFLTIIMLFSVALPSLAASVSAPNEEEPYYTVVFEDGVLTLRLDPDKVYEVLRDGELTREELKLFVPEDILNTVTDGTELTPEELIELAANHFSADDLVALKNMIPAEIFYEYFDIEMLEEVVTLDELLSIIDLDKLVEGIEDEEILALVNDEAFRILLNDKAKNEVLTDNFIKDILKADGNRDKIDALVEQKHDQLMDLVSNEVVNKLLDDPAYEDEKNALFTLIESSDTLDNILIDEDAVTSIKNYIVDYDLDALKNDDGAIERLKNSPKIRDFIATHIIVHDVVNELDVDMSSFAADFGITEEFLKTDNNASAIGLTASNVSPYVNVDAKTLFDNGIVDTSALATVYPQITVDAIKDRAEDLGISSDEAQTLDTVTDLIAAIDDYGKFCEIFNITADSLKENADALGITVQEVIAYVDVSTLIKELLVDDKLNVEKLCELCDITVNKLIDKQYLSNADVALMISDNWNLALNEGLVVEIVKCIGLHSLFEDFDRDGLVNAIGGYIGMIDKGFIDETAVLDAIGGYETIIDLFINYFPTKLDALIDIIGYENWKDFVELDDIVDRAGGYNVLAKWYSMSEISDVVSAIGVRNIIDFVNTSGIRDNVDLEGIARDVIELIRSKEDKIKPFAKDLWNCFTSIVSNEISTIHLNRTEENENIIYKYGEFDLQEIVTTVLQAIPDVDSFLEMESGDVFTQLIFTTSMRGKEIRFGIAIEFIGDLTRLKNFADSHRDYFVFDVSEDMDVTAEVVVPAVASELYERALLSERVPAKLKAKILEAPTMTLSDVKALLEGLTEEELEDYAAEVLEKADEIKAKVYAKLEEKLGTDNDRIEAAKLRVDEILDKCSDGEKLAALRDKGISAIDILYDKAGDVTVADIYSGNGVFSFDRSFSFDLYSWISKIVTIPDNLYIIFGNDLTLSGSVDATITVNGLYKATVIDEDKTVHEYFLPQGISMNILNKHTDVDYRFTDEVMPANDVTYIHETIYVIEFYNEAGELIRSSVYKEGEAPTVPTAPKKTGYTVEWSDYELFASQLIKVYPVYTAIPHNPSYSFNGSTIELNGKVSSDDTEVAEDIFPTISNAGYNFEAWYVDYNNDGVIGDGDFALEYDSAAGVYRLPDGKAFPVVDVENGGYIHFLPKFKAIEYTAGYMIDGEKFTLSVPVTVETREVSLPVLTKTGHTFSGWYVDYNSNGSIDDEDFMLLAPIMRRSIVIESEQIYLVPEGKSFPALEEGEEVSLLFVFEANNHTATFEPTDGFTGCVINFTYGDTALVGLPAFPAKFGHTGEWYVKLDSGDKPLTDYTLGDEDITVYAKYTANKHTATFEPTDGFTGLVIDFTYGDTALTDVPTFPTKDGYSGAWYVKLDSGDILLSNYTLGDENITVYAKYTANKHTATFEPTDGFTGLVIDFTYGDTALTDVPTFPTKDGYSGAWYVKLDSGDILLSNYTLGDEDITVYAKYEPNTYKVTFVAENEIIDEVEFKTGDTVLSRVPTAPSKLGYSVVWETYTLGISNLTVNAIYTPNTYKVTFVAENEIIDEVEFKTGDTVLSRVPTAPSKSGYSVVWETYTLGISNLTVNAIYTPNTYKVTFNVDGEVYKEVTYTYGDTSLENAPTVPEKEGYTAKWSDYTLGAANVEVNAEYSLIIYTATFKADGKVIATVNFTVEDKTITEPDVPTKDGYVGKWESYEISASDIVINAVYTEKGSSTDTDTETNPPIVIIDDDNDIDTLMWWLLLAIVIILLIIWIVSKKNEEKDKEPEPPTEAPAPTPESEPVTEPKAPVIEKVDTVDVTTADELMTDEIAATVLETVPGGCFSGLKAITNISDINAAFSDGDVVDLDALKAKKLVPAAATRLKVLANGTLNKSITVYSEQFSVQAVKMITLTGGKAIQRK